MRKTGIITLLALIGVLFLLGCKQATTADVWAEFTAENIDAEIKKYDGTFKNGEGTFFIVIDSQNKKIGYGESENLANFEMSLVTDFLANPKNKLSGSAGSKLTITIDGGELVCSKLPADTWTELTVDNMENEIAKYDGVFRGTGMVHSGDLIKMKMTVVFVFNAEKKQIGYAFAIKEEPIPGTDTIEQKDISTILAELENMKGTIRGNGKNKIQMIRSAEGIVDKLILTKQ